MPYIKQESIVLYADSAPMLGVESPGPHQTYRNPRLVLETRVLGDLRPTEVRIEVLYVGICGTDLHFVQAHPETGYMRTSSPASVPARGRVPGHEGVGRVLQVGAQVSHLHVGDYVALESIVVCGKCDRCQRGLPNQCRVAQLMGLQLDGLYATVVDVPASLAYDVTSLVSGDDDLQNLACMEPAGVAWEACRNARVARGERIIIFGAGPIGMYCAMLCQVLYGAAPHIVEPCAMRREFASKHICPATSPEEFFASGMDDIHVVFEASGKLGHIDALLRRMDAHGRIVLLGRSGEPLVLTGTDHLITSGIAILGSRGHVGGAFPALLDLYRRKTFRPGNIITSVVDGLPGLMDVLATPERVSETNAKVLARLPSAALAA